MGTQKNRLNATVLLSTQNTCLILWVRKYLQFYAENVCLSEHVAESDIICEKSEYDKDTPQSLTLDQPNEQFAYEVLNLLSYSSSVINVNCECSTRAHMWLT